MGEKGIEWKGEGKLEGRWEWEMEWNGEGGEGRRGVSEGEGRRAEGEREVG